MSELVILECTMSILELAFRPMVSYVSFTLITNLKVSLRQIFDLSPLSLDFYSLDGSID